MKFAFRTDASLVIGSGHVMRCLTLARVLRANGADVVFVCRLHSGHLVDLIRSEGFACATLASPSSSTRISQGLDYASWLGETAEQDATAVVEVLERTGRPDWLIVDHYGIGEEWEHILRPWCERIMVIDDLANRPHDCDLLLDQNLADRRESRYEQLVEDHCAKLLGPRYALLQSEYVTLHRKSLPRHAPVRRVFAYFGAADSGNLCVRVVQAFSRLARADVTLDVVASSANSFWSVLSDQVRDDARVRLHGHVPSLAPLLQDADVAFGAGGATSWERCCLGVPAYVVTLTENQVPGTLALTSYGAIRWLGDATRVSDDMLLEAVGEALEGESLPSMSSASLSLVDGWGAARVATALLAGPDTSFAVRTIKPEDEQLTLDWANDPEVRQNSFSSGRIDAVSHRYWLLNRMVDAENCRFFIVETTAGMPVGPVRFEHHSSGLWEVHYSMDRCLRSRGLGAAFLKAALDHFSRSVTSANTIIGRVTASNQASRHIFRKLGFHESSDDQGLLYRMDLQRLD